jgi:hypothetical protein
MSLMLSYDKRFDTLPVINRIIEILHINEVIMHYLIVDLKEVIKNSGYDWLWITGVEICNSERLVTFIFNNHDSKNRLLERHFTFEYLDYNP